MSETNKKDRHSWQGRRSRDHDKFSKYPCLIQIISHSRSRTKKDKIPMYNNRDFVRSERTNGGLSSDDTNGGQK